MKNAVVAGVIENSDVSQIIDNSPALQFVLFSCYSHQSTSDYSSEVYIVHSGGFAG